MKKIILYITIITINVCFLTSCNRGKESVYIGETTLTETLTETQTISGENNETNDTTNITKEQYIYDLVSALEIYRTPEEQEKFPAYKLLSEVIIEESTNTEKDIKDDTPNKQDQVVNVQYKNHETIDKFLDDTETTINDYKDLYIAHYPEDKYTVGIVIPADGNIDVQNKIEYYKNKLYDDADKKDKELYINSVVYTIGECIIISIAENSKVYSDGMESYIKGINELLSN